MRAQGRAVAGRTSLQHASAWMRAWLMTPSATNPCASRRGLLVGSWLCCCCRRCGRRWLWGKEGGCLVDLNVFFHDLERCFEGLKAAQLRRQAGIKALFEQGALSRYVL